MASLSECERALVSLAARLAEVDEDVRRRHTPERDLVCRVRDLQTVFAGRLGPDGLHDLHQTEVEGVVQDADVRITVTSDDLCALVAGDLPVGTAWATGRLRVQAPLRDVLRLRSLL